MQSIKLKSNNSERKINDCDKDSVNALLLKYEIFYAYEIKKYRYAILLYYWYRPITFSEITFAALEGWLTEWSTLAEA